MATNNKRKDTPQKEYEEKLLEVRKVTKVTRGGRRLAFRATMLIGNRKGKVGIGMAKGKDVTIAIKKAIHEAYKNIYSVVITEDGSVLYPMTMKAKSCIVKLLPASPGTGMKAGSSVRVVLELAGYTNILSKIVGSNNKINNALATISALLAYKTKKLSKKKEISKKTENKPEEKVESPSKSTFNKANSSTAKKKSSIEKKVVVKKKSSKKKVIKDTSGKKEATSDV